jgi:REP element-mobilizing transposase RayT
VPEKMRAANKMTVGQLSFGAAVTSSRRARRPKRGRPRGRKTVSHDRRDEFARHIPQHVTLRLHAEAPYIAKDWLMTTIRSAIAESHKPDFSIIEFNVLGNHLHLICEAAGREALARGVQGFEVRLARRLNKRLGRTGKLFAHRYHARALTSRKQVRNTLRYVLCNRKHHAAERKFDKFWVDPYSSGPWFTGWAQPIRSQRHLARDPKPTRTATVWLLTTGWLRYGPLAFDERPA